MLWANHVNPVIIANVRVEAEETDCYNTSGENLITSIRSFRRIDNVITYQLNFPLQVQNSRNHRQTEAHTTYVSIQSARLCKDGQPSQLVLVLGDSAAEPDNRQLLVNG